jgi:hypothetical protein
MAIIKTIPDPQQPATTIDAYAKYSRFGIDTEDNVIDLELAVYRSQAARDAVDGAGKPLYPPVLRERYRINDSGGSGPSGPIQGSPTYADYQSGDNSNPMGTGASIYGFLKAFTSWTGSTDA